jgi:hypothetical protein
MLERMDAGRERGYQEKGASRKKIYGLTLILRLFRTQQRLKRRRISTCLGGKTEVVVVVSSGRVPPPLLISLFPSALVLEEQVSSRGAMQLLRYYAT